MSPYTRIAEPISLTQDFTNLDLLSREEQQEKLRDLAARGEIVTAAFIAQKRSGVTFRKRRRSCRSELRRGPSEILEPRHSK